MHLAGVSAPLAPVPGGLAGGADSLPRGLPVCESLLREGVGKQKYLRELLWTRSPSAGGCRGQRRDTRPAPGEPSEPLPQAGGGGWAEAFNFSRSLAPAAPGGSGEAARLTMAVPPREALWQRPGPG